MKEKIIIYPGPYHKSDGEKLISSPSSYIAVNHMGKFFEHFKWSLFFQLFYDARILYETESL